MSDIPRALDGTAITPMMLESIKADVRQGRGNRRMICERYRISLDLLTRIQYGKLDAVVRAQSKDP